MVELLSLPAEVATLQSELLATSGRLGREWDRGARPIGCLCDIELIKSLSSRAAAMLPAENIDSWLAPRLHNALRIPRYVASDEGAWSWLALQCTEFVTARFQKGHQQLHPWRYRGSWSRNALSRLWWGAEMTRNGPDYQATELCFRRTRTAQFALELMYSWDRAAAIAFVRVAEGADGGTKLPDTITNALSTKLKIYLSLRSLDSIGIAIDDDVDEFDSDWAAHQPSLNDLLRNDLKLLIGPATGTCSESRIRELTSWLKKIVAEIRLETVSELKG